MQKEIYEQPEALLNTMRGRVRRVSEASGKLEVQCDIALIWHKCSRRIDTEIGTKVFVVLIVKHHASHSFSKLRPFTTYEQQ